MDTNPIFDYLYELETHRGYKNPKQPTLSGEQPLPWDDYRHFLRRMKRMFESCVFRCVAENPEFKGELHIIADKLRSLISVPDEMERLRLTAERDLNGIVSSMAADSLDYLRKYDINALDNSNTNSLSKSSVIPHFESLNITVEQAENLYDRLVQGGFLEDTGKEDFVYYYTGKGYQAKRQLRWKGNYIALSFLMRKLYPESMRISWKTLQQVYAEVDEKKANTMKNVLSKTMGGNGVYTKDSYEKMVDEWLK